MVKGCIPIIYKNLGIILNIKAAGEAELFLRGDSDTAGGEYIKKRKKDETTNNESDGGQIQTNRNNV